MKTLLIGHTEGIGKTIYEGLENIEGLSRSNGFDINNRTRKGFRQDNDIIILNAYGNFTSQLQTLYEFIEDETFRKEILIIVIGSNKAFSSYSKDIQRSKYHIEKQAINNTALDLNNLGYNISIINPGYVDTKYNKEKKVPKLDTKDILDMIQIIINSYYDKGILIENLTLSKKYENLS